MRLFQRQFALADGADISASFAYLGTGNSLFHKSCFLSPDPFPNSLGGLGGEDAAFIRSLVRRGIGLTWAAHAVVIEHVPTDRLTFSSMAARHFRQGQIRSLVRFVSPGLAKLEGLAWMVVGIAQLVVYGPSALVLTMLSPPWARRLGLKAISGLGKIFWQSPFWQISYGEHVVSSQEGGEKTKEAGSPVVSIVIVNYWTLDLTLKCLRSVISETRRFSYEILLVDNSADPELADAVAAEFPGVKLIVPSGNVGFAHANNIASEEARGHYLLLLNPDTIVLDGAIDRLVEFAQERPNSKIWGGRTLFADSSLNPTSCWRQMTLWNVVCRTAGLPAIFPNSSLFNSEAYGGGTDHPNGR